MVTSQSDVHIFIRSACRNNMSCVCLSWCFTSQSIAMAMLGWSVHLTTLISWASLTWVLNIQYFVYSLSLVTDNKVRKRAKIRNQEKEENGR